MKAVAYLIIVLLGVLPNRTIAQKQYTDRIQITAGNFIVPQGEGEKMFKPFLRNVGISVQKKLTPHFSVGLYYNKWYNWNKLYRFIPSNGNGYYEKGTFYTWKAGDIRARFDYQLIDIIGNYGVQYHHHELYAGAGISYATGKNDKITSVYQNPGYHDILVQSKTERGHYSGLVGQIGYDYLVFHNRINVGVSGALRYYPALSLQYYANINVGYNFKLH